MFSTHPDVVAEKSLTHYKYFTHIISFNPQNNNKNPSLWFQHQKKIFFKSITLNLFPMYKKEVSG